MSISSTDFKARLIIEPDEGPAPVREFISSAKKTLRIKQFSFTEPSLIEAVIERHKAGVEVKVMLNPQRSSGSRANDETLKQFQDAGIAAQWTNPKFYVSHEKSIVVDDTAALIATFNLCEKYFTQTRDYGMITVKAAKIKQVIDTFEADWKHETYTPTEDSGLLWSNSNSRKLMARFIDAAEETLDVQHPKFVDATILDRLVEAQHRGVKVRVLCGGKHGISDYDVLDTFSSLRLLIRAGVKVHKQKNYRLHAKLLLADGKHALLGSMNIDRSAFDLRRELGTFITNEQVLKELYEVFETDWDSSKKYDAPDPLIATEHLESDFEHDKDLTHE